MKRKIRIMTQLVPAALVVLVMFSNACSPDDTPVDEAISAKQKLPGTTRETSVAIANEHNTEATDSLDQSPTDDCENPVSCETFIGNIAYCAADGKRLTFCDSNIALTTEQTGWFVVDCGKAKTVNQLDCEISTTQNACQTNPAVGGCLWNTTTSKCLGTVKLNGLCTVNSSGPNPTADCT